MTVYCYHLVPKKQQFWTRERDNHLRSFYNDKIKVDPAILAACLQTWNPRAQRVAPSRGPQAEKRCQ
jgi:hypothetical protein